MMGKSTIAAAVTTAADPSGESIRGMGVATAAIVVAPIIATAQETTCDTTENATNALENTTLGCCNISLSKHQRLFSSFPCV